MQPAVIGKKREVEKNSKDAPASKTKWYSRQGLWSLFLMCAFPLHVWAIILVLDDFGWVSKRTNSWDAVGVAAYGLVFAFIESAVIFLAAALLGFLISRKWEENRRVVLMSALIFIVSLWAMFGQAYFLWGIPLSIPGFLIPLMNSFGHPARVLYAVAAVVVAVTVLIPTYFILRSEKTLRFALASIERVSVLTAFYLFLDFMGLVIVVIRNV